MGLWVKLDVELYFDDPSFVVLFSHSEAYALWWSRVVQLARRTCRKGRVHKANGEPATSRDLAIIHHRDPSRADEWETFLQLCLDEGLLTWVEEEQCLMITRWQTWYWRESDSPEFARERQQTKRLRQKENSGNVTDVTQCHARSRNVTQRHAGSRTVTDVTRGHACHAPDTDPDTYTHPDPSSSSDFSLTPAVTPNGNGKTAQILKKPREKEGRTDEKPISKGFEAFSEHAFKKLMPTATFGARQIADLQAFVRRNRGSPTKHGEIVEADILSALTYAVECTLSASQTSEIKSKWSYALTTAQEKLGSAVEWRVDREYAKAEGLADIGPFRFKGDEP